MFYDKKLCAVKQNNNAVEQILIPIHDKMSRLVHCVNVKLDSI